MMKFRIVALLLCLALVFALAACGSGTPKSAGTAETTQPAETAQSTEAAASTGGENKTATTDKTDLVVGVGSEPAGWDPLAEGTPVVITCGQCVFDKLFQIQDGEIVGDLVDSWEYSGDDNLTLTLKLKEGVSFQNGNPFTSEDALFAISRIAGNMVYSSRMASLDLDNCSCPDDYTVVLKLKYYDALLLACLTGEACYVYDKETYDEIGADAYSASPVGTGPYSFTTWNHGTSVMLTRNENYWGEKGAFSTIELKFYSEDNTRVLELEAGTLDLSIVDSGDNIDRIMGGEAAGVSGYQWETNKMGYFTMATTIADTTFQNENLRLAIAYALDIPSIVSAIMGSTGTPATSILPEENWAYVNSANEYNPDKAKECLKAAGYENGFTFEILVASDQNVDVKLAEAIQAYLSQVGITMNIRSADQFSVMGEQMGGTQLCGILTSTVRGDVMELFDPYTSGSGNCLAQIDDTQFNDLLSAARFNEDQATRSTALADLQAYVHDHALFIPLYQLNGAWGYQNYVVGVDKAAMGAEAVLDLTCVSFNNG